MSSPTAGRTRIIHVRGYIEEGTITTPFDMRVLNNLDRFHLAMDVIHLLPEKLGTRGAFLHPAVAGQAGGAQAVYCRTRTGPAGDQGLEVEQRKRQLRRIISFLFLQENQQPARQNPSDRRAFSFNFSILHSNPSFFRQGFCNPLGLQFFLRHAILKSAVLYNRISPDETLRILSPGKGD